MRTSIIILPDDDQNRKWIKWNLGQVRTLRQDVLSKLIQAGRLNRIARLKEVYSLAIQQELLAHMGRIGQLADPPAAFPVNVFFFSVGTDHKASRFVSEDAEPATCYVGRKKDSRQVFRLALTEQICDQIDQALRRLPEENVGQAARESLRAVKGDQGFIKKFERGVEISSKKTGKKFIKGEDNKTYAVITWDDEPENDKPLDNKDKKAALIIKVMSVSNDGDI